MDEIKKWVIAGSVVVVFVLGTCLAGCPAYGVWAAQKSGEAQLAEAMSNRKIKIQEAEAAEESAKHLAAAEVARAKGVAEANKIIGDSLHGNESYLRYLWIQNLSADKTKEVIYVPTEANLPVLEAGRRPMSDAPPRAVEKK